MAPAPCQRPSANVNEIVLLTLMPIIAAASMSWAVARMALPDLVLLTRYVRAIRSGSVTMRTMKSAHE